MSQNGLYRLVFGGLFFCPMEKLCVMPFLIEISEGEEREVWDGSSKKREVRKRKGSTHLLLQTRVEGSVGKVALSATAR
jgi:hypothetical protein